jgi:hypothetical protein
LDEAALNQLTDYHSVAAALDRLDAALSRIVRAPRVVVAPVGETPQFDPAPTGRVVEPQWAEDMANRLDALIDELRRTLSGDPT